jgi:hypothetical protein
MAETEKTRLRLEIPLSFLFNLYPNGEQARLIYAEVAAVNQARRTPHYHAAEAIRESARRIQKVAFREF